MLNKNLFKSLILIGLMLVYSLSFAIDVPIYDFPLETYSQNSNDYLPTDSEDYSTSILSENYQKNN